MSAVLPRGVTVALTALISLVWAANVVVGFVIPESRDPMINAIFAVVVGAVYALGRPVGQTARDARQRLAEIIAGRPVEPAATPDSTQDGEV